MRRPFGFTRTLASKALELEELHMEPEQVLELIHSAPERYESVRAALRYLGDGPVHKEIRERIVRRAFRVSPEEASEPTRHPEPDGPFGWRCRAWHADQYHWRMETEVPGGGVEITASKGRKRLPIGGPSGSGLVWNRRVGAGSRKGDPRWFMQATDHYWTFYPLLTDEICTISHELRSLDLTLEGPVVWAGREAVRLRGVPGEEWDWEWDPDPLHWGADEYEVVVDTERGVLLRCASRRGGKDFDALEVAEIYFDERFGEDVFTSREPLSWRS
jgi:hypothetical protein